MRGTMFGYQILAGISIHENTKRKIQTEFQMIFGILRGTKLNKKNYF